MTMTAPPTPTPQKSPQPRDPSLPDEAPLPRPPFLIRALDVPEQEGRYAGRDERFGLSRPIGKAAGLQRLGLHLERVPPGERISLPHAESNEEEFVYVLEGTVQAWVDGHVFTMVAGDLAAFPAGTGIAHTFLNEGAQEVLLLAGGEATKKDNQIVYPVDPDRVEHLAPERQWKDHPARPLGLHDGRPTRQGGF
jgi:uncharacterized cupin superfamily protein